MIKDDENYYNQTNFVRDDWGGQVRTPNVSPKAELTDDNMFNGSSNKPYKTEANFVQGSALDGFANQENQPSPAKGGNPMNEHFGQIKYTRREGAVSIYKDGTRNTANDNAASAKAEASTIYEDVDEGEETRR